MRRTGAAPAGSQGESPQSQSQGQPTQATEVIEIESGDDEEHPIELSDDDD